MGILIGISGLGLVGGCSDSSDSSSGSVAPISQPSASPTTSQPASSVGDSVATTPSQPSTTIVGPEPTGVPGLADPNPFCAAWTMYSSSLQAIGVAAAFAERTSEQIAVLELVAAPSVVDAVRQIADRFPAQLRAEHDVVVDQLLGPFARRAQRAVDELAAVGLTLEQIESLRPIWRQALTKRDPSDPAISLPTLDDAVNGQIVVASRTFDQQLTPFGEDPSLIVDTIDTPATDQYLAQTCPDLVSSGVGDAL